MGARRFRRFAAPRLESSVAAGGRSVDLLRAEHGFSALIEVRIGVAVRRVLYDAGATPDGLVGNLDRLGIDPTNSRRSCSAMAISTT